MFESCKSLAELNAARVKASLTMNIVEVNNAYNKRRYEILNSSSDFKKVETEPLTFKQPDLVSYMPYIGIASTPGHIEWTTNGFKA